ncbi:hypothetical protein CesoFtcFv8_012135 [Champsocephalus esox]|uniref:Uncharacterized protein n=1 Tax=Champsocephalus esox TaxID=159716 RepID=A0AAN8GUC3_9TELE|nr:hypothetical protein CesoFtcFv8_012135 [Champsocephalus esox]
MVGRVIGFDKALTRGDSEPEIRLRRCLRSVARRTDAPRPAMTLGGYCSRPRDEFISCRATLGLERRETRRHPSPVSGIKTSSRCSTPEL